MNRVQNAIATVTGLDEVISAQEAQLGEVADVMEHLVSDNQMLQRQIEDLDYLNIFEMGQIQEILPLRDRKHTLARLRRLRHDNPLAKQAVKLVVRFTLGKGIQWILSSEPDESAVDDTAPGAPSAVAPNPNPSPTPFTRFPSPTKLVQIPRAGRAKEAIIEDKPDPTRDILEAFWYARDNKLVFTTHKALQQTLDDIVTDGEKFYACFEDPSPPYLLVTELPIEEIQQIIYDPDNRLRPCFYKRIYQETIYDGKAETYTPVGKPKTEYYWDYRVRETDRPDILKRVRIPGSKINKDASCRHVMINDIWTKGGKRGLSELYSSREWFRVFREFMEGRANINAAAQAISYVRKIKGGPTAVASFKGKLGGVPVGDGAVSDGTGELRRLTKPVSGAIYDSNDSVDLDWMKTDTGAANAKEDARLLLMSAGAGVGTMVHYFGEGGDANLATAQSMELPMVKSYEDWQQFVEDFLLGWFQYVLEIANNVVDDEGEREVEDELKRVGFSFPPIVSQDVVKYTTSWSQIVRDIAPNNMAVRTQAIRGVLAIMGVPNIDGLMPEIEAEMQVAEQHRIEQQQAMADLAAQAADAATRPPVAGQIPNAGLDPNTKRIVAGKPEKVANGPKSA